MKLKNILGTLETPETSRAHSRLFPESPSMRSLAIVSQPEWQAAIEYRVNDALYGLGKRRTAEILFPRVMRRFPAYDSEINQQIFTEEEAVKMDRHASFLIGPPSREQIEIEEIFRRPILLMLDYVEQKRWDDLNRAAPLFQAIIDRFRTPAHQQIARRYAGDTLSYLFRSKLEESRGKKDMQSVLDILRLIKNTPAVHDMEYQDIVNKIVKDPAIMDNLATIFMRNLNSAAYEDLLRQCEEYGFPMDALKKQIRERSIDELVSVLLQQGPTDFFRWLDFTVRHEVFSEEELASIQEFHTAILEYSRKFIGEYQWVSGFRGFLAQCQQLKVIADSYELATHPVIVSAAQKYIIQSFEEGTSPDNLRAAADMVRQAGIMKREDALALPQILQTAEGFLVKIFTENILNDDPATMERLYVDIVGKYVDAGIGTRTYFDNVPAIKHARAAAAKKRETQ